jgi:hypothetical protein
MLVALVVAGIVIAVLLILVVVEICISISSKQMDQDDSCQIWRGFHDA